jgi:hypothetical protein
MGSAGRLFPLNLVRVTGGRRCSPINASACCLFTGVGNSVANPCWYGSGSAGPYLWLMDVDPDSDSDPAIYVSDLQDVVFGYYLVKVHLHNFSKIKSQKTVGIIVFLTIFD